MIVDFLEIDVERKELVIKVDGKSYIQKKCTSESLTALLQNFNEIKEVKIVGYKHDTQMFLEALTLVSNKVVKLDLSHNSFDADAVKISNKIAASGCTEVDLSGNAIQRLASDVLLSFIGSDIRTVNMSNNWTGSIPEATLATLEGMEVDLTGNIMDQGH